LGPRDLLFLWSQVRATWLLIWWLLEAYMIVNFRTRGISRGTRKLIWTPILNLKKNQWTCKTNTEREQNILPNDNHNHMTSLWQSPRSSPKTCSILCSIVKGKPPNHSFPNGDLPLYPSYKLYLDCSWLLDFSLLLTNSFPRINFEELQSSQALKIQNLNHHFKLIPGLSE